MPNKLNIVLTLFIAVCWIRGFHYTFLEGEIFGKIGEWMRKNLPEWIQKPTFNCPYCMSSVWGTFIFCVFLCGSPIWLWVIFCFCVCGFIGIVDKK